MPCPLLLVPSPQYSGERVRVRGLRLHGAGHLQGPSPPPSPQRTGEREKAVSAMTHLNDPSCHRFPRRTFLADLGMGFTGLVLGSMLQRDGVARADVGISAASDALWTPPD